MSVQLRDLLIVGLTMATWLASSPSSATAQTSDDHLKQAVERAKQATVGILNATPEARQSGYDAQLSFRGTGVHLRNGYILTARHAVERQSGSTANVPPTILILTQRLEELPAKLVGDNPYLDLVLYKLAYMVDSLEGADLSFSALDATTGQQVFTVGYPLGWGPTIAYGRIGNPNTFLQTVDTRLIQSDVPVCSGNSGGGLFNAEGELVGIMHAIIKTDEAQGGHGCSRLAFAVPGGLAKKIVTALLENKQPGFSRLGLQMKAVKIDNRWRVAVGGVSEPASLGGVQKGDLLLAINDTEITDSAQLKNYLMERTIPGQKVILRVLRGDKELALTITLGGV
ncbi:MAG: trypsin-like peptidase domain-containing protein [Nitrospirota bacterium]|nr:trypsin-like peptidase domain-containing protein [Nitrospirota bacterium]